MAEKVWQAFLEQSNDGKGPLSQVHSQLSKSAPVTAMPSPSSADKENLGGATTGASTTTSTTAFAASGTQPSGQAPAAKKKTLVSILKKPKPAPTTHQATSVTDTTLMNAVDDSTTTSTATTTTAGSKGNKTDRSGAVSPSAGASSSLSQPLIRGTLTQSTARNTSLFSGWSQGQDSYWSQKMKETLEKQRQQGKGSIFPQSPAIDRLQQRLRELSLTPKSAKKQAHTKEATASSSKGDLTVKEQKGSALHQHHEHTTHAPVNVKPMDNGDTLPVKMLSVETAPPVACEEPEPMDIATSTDEFFNKEGSASPIDQLRVQMNQQVLMRSPEDLSLTADHIYEELARAQKSPNLEHMMDDLDNIVSSLEAIPSPPARQLPPNKSHCQPHHHVKFAPSPNVSSTASPVPTVSMTCALDGTVHHLRPDQWSKLALRHGKIWIVEGSTWTRLLLSDTEMREPTVNNVTDTLLILEGINDDMKDKWMSDVQDNFICRSCSSENHRR